MLRNTKARRQIKREAAEARQAAYSKLSLKDKMAKAGKRELAKLQAKAMPNG